MLVSCKNFGVSQGHIVAPFLFLIHMNSRDSHPVLQRRVFKINQMKIDFDAVNESFHIILYIKETVSNHDNFYLMVYPYE